MMPDDPPQYAIVFVPAGQQRPWRVDGFWSEDDARAKIPIYQASRSINALSPVTVNRAAYCVVRLPDSRPEWGELCP